jgi:hypothetical protein
MPTFRAQVFLAPNRPPATISVEAANTTDAELMLKAQYGEKSILGMPMVVNERKADWSNDPGSNDGGPGSNDGGGSWFPLSIPFLIAGALFFALLGGRAGPDPGVPFRWGRGIFVLALTTLMALILLPLAQWH